MERNLDISYPGRSSRLNHASRKSTPVSKILLPDQLMGRPYSNDHPLHGNISFTRNGINTSTHPTLSQDQNSFLLRYHQQNSHAVEGCGSSTSSYSSMDNFKPPVATQHITRVVHSEVDHDALRMSQSEEPSLHNVNLSNEFSVHPATSKFLLTPSIDKLKTPWISIRHNYEYSWTPDESIATASQPSFDFGHLDIEATQSMLGTPSEMNDDSSSSRRASETSMGPVSGYLHAGMLEYDHSTRHSNQREIASLV